MNDNDGDALDGLVDFARADPGGAAMIKIIEQASKKQGVEAFLKAYCLSAFGKNKYTELSVAELNIVCRHLFALSEMATPTLENVLSIKDY